MFLSLKYSGTFFRFCFHVVEADAAVFSSLRGIEAPLKAGRARSSKPSPGLCRRVLIAQKFEVCLGFSGNCCSAATVSSLLLPRKIRRLCPWQKVWRHFFPICLSGTNLTLSIFLAVEFWKFQGRSQHYICRDFKSLNSCFLLP